MPGKDELKRALPYAGLPVLAALLFVVQSGRQAIVVLLLREVLLAAGYLAAVKDFQERRVPNRLVLGLLGAWVLVIVPQLFFQTETALALMITGLIGAASGGTVFLTVYLVSRRGLGGGDVKLMTVSGLYLGLSGTLSAMLYGCLLAAVVSIVLLLSKKLGPKDAIPLVPFLYTGMVLAMLIQ